MSIREQIQAVAADVLHLSHGHVTLDTSPEQVESWDSVTHLQLVLALEERFGVFFEPEEVEQMESVGHIVTLLHAKLGAGV